MKRDTLSAIAASAFVWLVAFPSPVVDSVSAKTDFAIFALCRVEQHVELSGSTPRIAIESGMGDGGFAIATTSPSSQQWFDYGIKLFHAFYQEDSWQAFNNAVAADPACALCLWGQALARGPNQNFDASQDNIRLGFDDAQKALAAAHTEREKLLAAAMIRRYSRPQDAAAERDFAAELLKAEAAGPGTPDLRLLAAEALLTAYRRGDHSTATEAMALIEPILQKMPQNTAAMHYYIHATEFAGKPALALAYAEKLPSLAPKASHLVHMAAHTFLRVGRYEDAATANASALLVDADYFTKTATPGPPAAATYYGHNLSFGMAGALMSGDRALALKFADHVHRAYPDRVFINDWMVSQEFRRFIIYARYDPKRMLSLPEPSADNRLTLSLYHYARGEAFAALHDAAGLSREAEQISGGSPTVDLARNVLAGRLAMLQGHYAAAATAFGSAAEIQETILASIFDPPPWWYPVRRSAAAAFLLDGKFAQAAEMATTSLKAWPSDPLALLIRSRAEDRLSHTSEARRDDAEAVGNWKGDIAKVDLTGI